MANKLIEVLLLLIIVPLLCSCSTASEKLICQPCDDLKAIKMELSQKIRRTPEQNHKLVMKSVSVIENSIKNIGDKHKEGIVAELVSVLGAINSIDSYHINVETALPVYKKHKALFEKHLNALPSFQSQSVRKSIRLVIREEKEGNG